LREGRERGLANAPASAEGGRCDLRPPRPFDRYHQPPGRIALQPYSPCAPETEPGIPAAHPTLPSRPVLRSTRDRRASRAGDELAPDRRARDPRPVVDKAGCDPAKQDSRERDHGCTRKRWPRHDSPPPWLTSPARGARSSGQGSSARCRGSRRPSTCSSRCASTSPGCGASRRPRSTPGGTLAPPRPPPAR
jgi:hypothetical protein